MKHSCRLPIAACLVALALTPVVSAQVELVPNDATYDYLLTIKDIGGVGLAVDPTADPNFAFIDVNAPETSVAIWAFQGFDLTQPVNGAVRDTGAPETLDWRQADAPFQYGGVNAIVNAGSHTDPLIDANLPFTEDQLDGQKITQYFRTDFTTTEQFSTILLDVLIDDAAVFYVDGLEVARYNCCNGIPGVPPFDAPADDDNDVGSEDIRNNAWAAPFTAGGPNAIDLTLLGGTLPAGDHVFALEVHSYGGFTSSDMGFDVIMTATNEENQWSGLSGSWTNGTNWTLSIPNGVDAVANLWDVPTAATTIYHNGGITLGTLNIDNANKYAISGLGTFTFETTGADGLIDVIQGDHEFQAPVAILNNTSVNVAEGASLEFNNDLSLNGNNLTITGGGSVSVNNAVFAAGGAVNAAAGAMIGNGTIHGDLVNSGATLSPGESAGSMTVEGDFSQGPDGIMEIEIAGTDVYDQLSVGGEFDFGGTLVVSLLDGFEPALGDEFAVFTFSSASNAFDYIVLPELEGLAWDTSGLYAAGSLAVTVPEPAGLLLLLAGLGFLSGTRRRLS